MKRTRRRRQRPGHTERQRAWINSARWKAERKAGSEKARIARRSQPLCGAKRKSDGQPCRRLALRNGKCRLHGGETRAAALWHVVVWPDPITQPERYAKKLREVERRRQFRAARIAAMRPDEREEFERRSRAAQPRTPAERESRRRDREVREILERPRITSATPEIAALAAELAEVRKERERLQAIIATESER
jgi:hypothetical protein